MRADDIEQQFLIVGSLNGQVVIGAVRANTVRANAGTTASDAQHTSEGESEQSPRGDAPTPGPLVWPAYDAPCRHCHVRGASKAHHFA